MTREARSTNKPSWGGKRFFGDVELVQLIEGYQPSMVISGHVRPVHIVPDIDGGTAFWLAAGDEQTINHAPLQRPAAPIADPPAWLTSLPLLLRSFVIARSSADCYDSPLNFR